MDASSSIIPQHPRVEPKAEFKRDEYILLTLPRDPGLGYVRNAYPIRLSIDDALDMARQLADALEAAGYGPSKRNPDCHACEESPHGA